MKAGDLVRIKEGCGDEGRMGLLLQSREKGQIFLFVNFPEGVEHINSFWLEEVFNEASGFDH